MEAKFHIFIEAKFHNSSKIKFAFGVDKSSYKT